MSLYDAVTGNKVRKTFDVNADGATLTYFYRVALVGREYPAGFTAYTPGVTTLGLVNETGELISYKLQTKIVSTWNGVAIRTDYDDHVIVVQPTPVIHIDNFSISPDPAQVSGAWSFGFDVSTSPEYTGDVSRVVSATYQFRDADDIVQYSGSLSLSNTGNSYSGTVDGIGYFTTSAVTGASGDIDITVNASYPNTTITAVASANTYSDRWESVFISGGGSAEYAINGWDIYSYYSDSYDELGESEVIAAAGLDTEIMTLKAQGSIGYPYYCQLVVVSPAGTVQVIEGPDLGYYSSFDLEIPLTAFAGEPSAGTWIVKGTDDDAVGEVGLDSTSTLCFGE
jgi:hypothetical protein